MSSFFVQNFGCRATQADGAAIERDLLARGFDRAALPSDASVVVLNTCTVTASADQDVRASIRRIYRNNPDVQILVTGCYAQRAPEELAAMPGVSIVVGNSHKHELARIVAEGYSNGAPRRNFVSLSQLSGTESFTKIYIGDIFAHTELLAAPVFDASSERTRPNLKVQDGCDNRCSFCIIPFVRGQSRSLRLDEVIAQTNQLVAAGYKEVVISGINLGRWGRDLDDSSTHHRFEDLVRAILERTDLQRLRISSVEPMDWSDELISLCASSPRIAKHAHVPLQSGSDRILRKMHRKYRPWHYADKLTKIRAAMPTAAIGADVMVGFPGETDLDFEETRALIEQLPFTYLHVFTYSSRPGTASSIMPDQVPVEVARERNRILRELAARKKREFQQRFVGGNISAITLTVQENGRTEALTDNYQKLWIDGAHAANELVDVHVTAIEGDALVGHASEFQPDETTAALDLQSQVSAG